MKILYEAQSEAVFPWAIAIGWGLICIALLWIALTRWKQKEIGEKLFVIVPIIVIGIYWAWLYQCITVPDLYGQYQKGEYQICEGVIEEYQPALVDGGVLKEGMGVKIYYIPQEIENVIMKIEIES